MVKTLHSRARAICTHIPFKDQETWHIGQTLIKNGYPRGLIQHHTTAARSRPTDDQTQGPIVTLPYVHGLFEAVRRVLAPLGVRVSFRPEHHPQTVTSEAKSVTSPVVTHTQLYRHSPYIVAYIKRVTCFVPATDEDNRMVVETVGKSSSKTLASEVRL